MRVSLLAFVVSMGCSAPESAPTPVPGVCDEGGAWTRVGVSTTACLSFLDAEAKGRVVVDPYKGPVFSSPPTSASLSPSTPPTFTWSAGTLAARKSILRWFALEGTAWAHHSASDMYVLRLSADSEVLRVMTNQSSYTPGAADWARLARATTLRAELVQVRLDGEEVSATVTPTSASSPSWSVH